MEKRPEEEHVDVAGQGETMENQAGPLRQWRNALGGIAGQLSQMTGQAFNLLYNYTTATTKAIASGGTTRRRKSNRRLPPSETIDDDVSTASVFVVTILLMIIVTMAIFFAISSSFPVVTGP